MSSTIAGRKEEEDRSAREEGREGRAREERRELTNDLIRMFPRRLESLLEELLEQLETRTGDSSHDVDVLLQFQAAKRRDQPEVELRSERRGRTIVSLNGAASNPMFPGLFESMKPKSM